MLFVYDVYDAYTRAGRRTEIKDGRVARAEAFIVARQHHDLQLHPAKASPEMQPKPVLSTKVSADGREATGIVGAGGSLEGGHSGFGNGV